MSTSITTGGRGVQLHDVCNAADALVAAGQRPTIERVRLKIGRGSPNTIAPLLDAWFEGLGERLGLSPSANPAAPPVLQQAMQALWHQALEQAHVSARQALLERETALGVREAELEGGWAALREQTLQFEARERLLQERLDALQQELQVSRDNAQAALRKVEQFDARLQEAAQTLQIAQQARNEERLRHDQQLQALLHESEKQRDIHQREQKRLLNQVDRERQELSKLEKKYSENRKSGEAAVRELQRVNANLGERLHAAQLEIASLEARSQSQVEQIAGLQARLDTFEPRRPPRTRKKPTKKSE